MDRKAGSTLIRMPQEEAGEVLLEVCEALNGIIDAQNAFYSYLVNSEALSSEDRAKMYEWIAAVRRADSRLDRLRDKGFELPAEDADARPTLN